MSVYVLCLPSKTKCLYRIVYIIVYIHCLFLNGLFWKHSYIKHGTMVLYYCPVVSHLLLLLRLRKPNKRENPNSATIDISCYGQQPAIPCCICARLKVNTQNTVHSSSYSTVWHTGLTCCDTDILLPCSSHVTSAVESFLLCQSVQKQSKYWHFSKRNNQQCCQLHFSFLTHYGDTYVEDACSVNFPRCKFAMPVAIGCHMPEKKQ